jgi:hypothetical protein
MCSTTGLDLLRGVNGIYEWRWTLVEIDACIGDESDMYMRTLTNLDVSRIIGYAFRHRRQRIL